MQLAIAALHCACLLQSTTDPNQFTHHEMTQFHILNWSAQGKCSEVLTITNVIEEMYRVQCKTGNNPVVVHCQQVRNVLCHSHHNWPVQDWGCGKRLPGGEGSTYSEARSCSHNGEFNTCTKLCTWCSISYVDMCMRMHHTCTLHIPYTIHTCMYTQRCIHRRSTHTLKSGTQWHAHFEHLKKKNCTIIKFLYIVFTF